MAWLTKYLSWELGKRLGWALVRWGIKKSPNQADDAMLAIRDKIVSGNLDGIEKDVETLGNEISRLLDEDKKKKDA